MLTTAFLVLAGKIAIGGGISSGGGEFIGDRANPWYLQNTAEVRYCLALDPVSFSLPLPEARRQVEAAFAYWTGEMAKYLPKPGPYLPPYPEIVVGTQRFVETSCTPDVDIVFQLGTLTAAQREVLDADLNMTVGHTHRLSYDQKTLRGRGFIYIAADQGAFFVPAQAIAPNAWSWNRGAALYAILTHEIGHIFGLFDGAQGTDIMSYTFAQNTMQLVVDYPNETRFLFLPDTVRITKNLHPGPDYCLPSDRSSRLWQEQTLGLPRDASPCVATHYQNGVLQILGGPNTDQLEVIGAAKLIETAEDSTSLVSVWLPPDQQVYRYAQPGKTIAANLLQPVVYQKIVTATGLYQPSGAQSGTHIYLDLDPAKPWPPKILGVFGSAIRDLYRYRAEGPLPGGF